MIEELAAEVPSYTGLADWESRTFMAVVDFCDYHDNNLRIWVIL